MSFTQTDNETYLMIRTTYPVISDKEARELDELLKKKTSPVKQVIFDFSTVDQIFPSGLRALTLVVGSLSQNETKAAFITTKHLTSLIKSSGLV